MIVWNSVNPLRTGRARKLVRNFKEAKWAPNDTRSVFYNREHCDQLIEELSRAGVSGLRVYFGSYEADHSNPKRRGKNMLIFVTTAKDGDFDNNLLNDPLEQELPEQSGEGYISIDKEMDDGALCPPVGCNGSDTVYELWPNP